MPAVFALERVLEFLDINDYWSTALLDKQARNSSKLANSQRSLVSLRRLPIQMNQLLAFQLDVESAHTRWAVSEELHVRDTL